MRTLRSITATGIALATFAGVGIGPALADPGPSVPTNAIVGLATYTNCPVMLQVSADFNTANPTAPGMYVFCPSSTPIQTKGTQSADPKCHIVWDGDPSEGIGDLGNGVTTPDGIPCVDFVSIDRKRSTTDPSTIVFDAFAKDAITWTATSPADGGHAPIGASLTPAQLGEIYTCQPNGTSYTWNQIFGGTASSDPIDPILPEITSGTRETFLSDIGVTTPGACVTNASGTQAIEENEGTNAVFKLANGNPNPDVIFPYSVGVYIAQADHKAPFNNQLPGSLLPQDLTNGTNHVFPISGTGTSAKIASGLPNDAYRLLYIVTRNANTTGGMALPAYLVPIFGNATQKGWICSNATAEADITLEGFLNLGAACGTLS